jgi:hypothetical protein
MVTIVFEVRSRVLRTAVVAMLAASCTRVLGIDDARVDPTLSGSPSGMGGVAGVAGASVDGGPGGAGGTAGEGGHSGTGGSDADASSDASPDMGPTNSEGGSYVCRQYCDDLMSFCSGNVAQYIDTAQCLKVCALFPEGTVGGADGNHAACRMKYAGKARYSAGSERDAYCRKAGPGSDGTCGTICDSFCLLMMPTCTAAKTPPYFFSSLGSCLTTCRMLKDNPPYTVADGTLPDTNDAQCRLFHVTSAVMDPDEHCEHAMGVTMCDGKIDAAADAAADR